MISVTIKKKNNKIESILVSGHAEYDVEGKKVYYASNVAMYPNSYTLGLTYEFEILLDKYRDIMEVEINYE